MPSKIKIEKEEKERIKRLIEEECINENLSTYINRLKTILEALNENNLKKASNTIKYVSNTNRIKILYLVKEKEMCVCELTVLLGLSQPTISHHLNMLEKAGLIKCKPKRKWRYYSLTPNGLKIVRLLNTII